MAKERTIIEDRGDIKNIHLSVDGKKFSKDREYRFLIETRIFRHFKKTKKVKVVTLKFRNVVIPRTMVIEKKNYLKSESYKILDSLWSIL